MTKCLVFISSDNLTFNISTLDKDYLEYNYEVIFDTDADSIANCSISTMHFKSSLDEIQGDLISNTQSDFWIYTSATSFSRLASFGAEFNNNKLLLTVPKSLDSVLESA